MFSKKNWIFWTNKDSREGLILQSVVSISTHVEILNR